MTGLPLQNTATPRVPPPFQFSLRALFVVITLASLVAAGAAVVKQVEEQWESAMLEIEQEIEAIAQLQRLWGIIDNPGSGSLVQLGGTKVTDADLIILPRVHSARYISLYDTAVTDAGLVHMRSLQHLERLDLSHTQVTPEGIAQLHRAMPGVTVYRD